MAARSSWVAVLILAKCGITERDNNPTNHHTQSCTLVGSGKFPGPGILFGWFAIALSRASLSVTRR